MTDLARTRSRGTKCPDVLSQTRQYQRRSSTAMDDANVGGRIIDWEFQDDIIDHDDDDDDLMSWDSNEPEHPANVIQWTHGETCLQFIESIETRVFHPGAEHCLRVEDLFLSAFYDLDDDQVRLVEETLLNVHDLDSFRISNMSYPESQAHQLRFQQLFQILGGISNVARADVFVSSNDAAEIQATGQIIGLLRQVSSMNITGSIIANDEVTLEELGDSLQHMANGLQAHPSICECFLRNIPTMMYSALLPVMPTIPHLQLLLLGDCFHRRGTGSYVRPIDAAALRNLLQSDLPELLLEIQHLNFTNPESFALFCDGVSTLGIGSFELEDFKCGPGGHQLADAVVASNLRHVSLSWLTCLEDAELTAATAALTRGLPTMARLESITCGMGALKYGEIDDNVDVGVREEAVAAVVRAAARCACLKKLSVDASMGYTSKLDDVFCHCITSNRGLLEVTIKGHPTTHDASIRCPGLSRALKHNYWIKHIHLTHRYGYSPGDVWNTNDEKMLDVMLRLNRCNRRYLQDEAFNKHAATQVLADVGDDMDCIYYHLLENPSILYREE